MYAQHTFHLHSHGNYGRVYTIVRQEELYLQLEAGVDLKFFFFFALSH